MNLHQMNITYEPVQDRLLLRISTIESQEFQFWLTRRMVARLWPGLLKTLKSDTALAADKTPSSARPEWLEFQHAEAIQNTDLKTPYSSTPKVLALGEAPALAQQISLTPLKSGNVQMKLAADTRAEVCIVFKTSVLHALLKLVQDGARAAEWGLELALPVAPAASLRIN